MNKTLIAAALSLAAAVPAQALTFEGAVTQGATVAEDYSDAGLMAIYLEFRNGAPVVMNWRVDADDLLAPIAFNAVIGSYTGAGLQGLTLTVDSGAFASVGSVTRHFGGSVAVSGSGATRTVLFSPEEYYDIEIGNPFGENGQQDWTLSQAGFQVGDRLSLTVSAVPEPSQYALLLAGLAGVGVLARRRRAI